MKHVCRESNISGHEESPPRCAICGRFLPEKRKLLEETFTVKEFVAVWLGMALAVAVFLLMLKFVR
jgi:hypothetical protein